MYRFWNQYIKPVMDCARPNRIMEIGADFGWNTSRILAWCEDSGSHLEIVDPAPRPELQHVLAASDASYTFHPQKSLDAVEQIEPVDLVLLDGDHNWWTVFNELSKLFAHAADHGRKPPIVLSHDVAWPYARRDMYYNPTDLDGSQRHPYAYRGVLPGVSELTDEGMNGILANAQHEGGPRNGVLTAIEDFIAACEVPITLYKLPFFNGLGILVPDPRETPELSALIEGFFSTESLLHACQSIEENAMHLRAKYTQLECALTDRTDALVRARERLTEKSARIDELEHMLQEREKAGSSG